MGYIIRQIFDIFLWITSAWTAHLSQGNAREDWQRNRRCLKMRVVVHTPLSSMLMAASRTNIGDADLLAAAAQVQPIHARAVKRAEQHCHELLF